jgi:hypothetical protein
MDRPHLSNHQSRCPAIVVPKLPSDWTEDAGQIPAAIRKLPRMTGTQVTSGCIGSQTLKIGSSIRADEGPGLIVSRYPAIFNRKDCRPAQA